MNAVYSADLDGDGDLDVLGAAAGNSNDVTWWENTDGEGTSWTKHVIDGNFLSAKSVYAADLDGDGDLDVLGAGAGSGDDVTWWENTAGDGSTWTEHLLNGNFDGACSVYAADLDGDGDPDFLAAGSDCDAIVVYLSNSLWWDESATVRIAVAPDNDDPTAADDDAMIAKPTMTYSTGVLITDKDTDYADLVVTVTESSTGNADVQRRRDVHVHLHRGRAFRRGGRSTRLSPIP